MIRDIDYNIALYYSYLLPLFKTTYSNGSLVFVKEYGVCSGLKCISREAITRCFTPRNCYPTMIEKILGLDKYRVVKRLFGKLSRYGFTLKTIKGFTLLYSPWDKFYIATAIYLSRNTDYYRNTVKWVREIISRKCYLDPGRCREYSYSYQFREYLENVDRIYMILENSYEKPFDEALKLLEVRGFGVKSVMAYLLHTYGYLEYAPIDRYYRETLERLGISGIIPSKNKCIRHRIDCKKCSYRDNCLYNIVRERFREYNGILQSLTYIYNRLKNANLDRPGIEESILKNVDIDALMNEIEALINIIPKELE